MYPPIIQTIAELQIREYTERAEARVRVRQAMAAARQPGGRPRRRTPVAVFRLRFAKPRAA